MNNIILTDSNYIKVDESTFELLCEKTIWHLKNVLGLAIKKCLSLNVIIPNLGATVGEFKILENKKVYFTLNRNFKNGRKRLVHLAIASTRPLMAKRVLEHATTLGASSLNFFPAESSEKSYLSAKIYKSEVAQEFILKGMSQCRQFCSRPDFLIRESLDEVIDDFKRKGISCYWLDHEAKMFFDQNHVGQEILLLIGPERGWTKKEKIFFEQNGIIGIKLSNSVMRVEFAVNAAFAQLEYITNCGKHV